MTMRSWGGALLSRREALAALSAAGIARTLRGQDSPTFSGGVKVVNVLANVHNAKGEIVRNLTKEDFTLEEDGRPQTIAYFARETDLPLTLGLLVDTSRSQRRVLPEEKRASYKFLEKVLRWNKDQAFLIRFERDVELLKDLTGSRKDLESALNSVDAPDFSRPGERDAGSGSSGDGPSGNGSSSDGSSGNGTGGRYPRGGGRARGGTSLYDAVFLASDDVLKKQQGRRALIVLSDGVDNTSKIRLTRAIETAQRADTLVYSIYFADAEEPGGRGFGGFGGVGGGGAGGRRGGGRSRMPPRGERPDGKKVLEQISRETGGAFFEISKKHPIDDVYQQIEDQLRSEYNLGYTPDRAEGAGYRKILVSVKEKGLIVQARDGYYADR